MKEMLQSLGFVTTIEIENRVVAITLNTVVGDELYFHVIAHDPEYNYYRLGQQALYYSIKQFIEKGGKKFHLLWGEYDYKYKFKGDKNLLYTYKIVRPGRILQLVKAKYKADKAMDFLSNLSLKKITFHLKQKLSDIKN